MGGIYSIFLEAEVSVFSFIKCVSLLPIYNWVLGLFVIDLQEPFIYSRYESFVRYVFCKHISPSLLLPFSFLKLSLVNRSFKF